MRASLRDLLGQGRVLLADGATGTNYFAMGLDAGEPPEFWVADHPDRVMALHQQFVDAGADIVLTDTFGCTRHRLKLHRAEHRVAELASGAARLARTVADAAAGAVVVAGSVGPTGELFEPLGALTEDDAIDAFREQIQALVDGGADVAWIETMSAPEEARAAAKAAIEVGVDYVCTMSFDTAGRTMMGLQPGALESVFTDLPVRPLAVGANCGVGASDILVSLLEMSGFALPTISKGNCGIPRFEGTSITYSGTPDLMARYAALAVDAGVAIVGGCCGTSPEHLAAMRASLDGHHVASTPTVEQIVEEIGPLTNALPGASPANRRRRRDS